MRLKCEIKRDPFLPILNFFRNLTAHILKGKRQGRGEKEGRKERKKPRRERQDKSIRIWTGNISEYFI